MQPRRSPARCAPSTRGRRRSRCSPAGCSKFTAPAHRPRAPVHHPPRCWSSARRFASPPVRACSPSRSSSWKASGRWRRVNSAAAPDSRSEIALGRQPATTDARRLAWHVLTAVEHGAFADAALGERLRTAALEPRDRSLATQLVYGTLAWQGLLDRAAAQAGRDPQDLDAPVRTLLRLALFQLVRLERVPHFAAVDTAVELAKEFKRGAASGLVNAVLRRFLRQGSRIDVAPREADLAGHLAAALSHPRWLVERWLAELGAAETEALLTANNTAAPTVARVNRRRADAAHIAAALEASGTAARPARYAADALILDPSGDPSRLPGFRDGWFSLQGEASQLVVAMLDPAPDARVLDVCA